VRKTLNPVIVNLYFHLKCTNSKFTDVLSFFFSKSNYLSVSVYSLKNVYFSKITLKITYLALFLIHVKTLKYDDYKSERIIIDRILVVI